MSKAYPSNLSLAQYEFLSDMIPEPKPGSRPRTVNMWEIFNAIFYVLCEGVQWRALPSDFPAWQTVYPNPQLSKAGLNNDFQLRMVRSDTATLSSACPCRNGFLTL